MRFLLHLICSLLTIILISSCFLFYSVACENAKNITAKPDINAATSTEDNSQEINAGGKANEALTNNNEQNENENEKEESENQNQNENKNEKLANINKNVNFNIFDTLYQNADNSQLRYTTDKINNINNNNDVDSMKNSVIKTKYSDVSRQRSTRSKKASIRSSVKNVNRNNLDIIENLSSVNDINSGSDKTVKENIREKAEFINDKAFEIQSDNEEFQDAEDKTKNLPNIGEIPIATVAELPLEMQVEPTLNNLNSIVIDAAVSGETKKLQQENQTMEILENSNQEIHKDAQIIKINDSGGGDSSSESGSGNVNEYLEDANIANRKEIPVSRSKANIPNDNVTTETSSTPSSDIPTTSASASSSSSSTTTTASSATPATDASTSSQIPSISSTEQEDKGKNATTETTISTSTTVNLTAEEVPIPVFSEWAQKQMEEAEKQQAKEQEVVNTATQKKLNNNTNGSGKAPSLKIRAKNYASPDCGAKIIASNSDASNTDAVLSSSADEYMLSPCGNRIWFVVELCEAIQAQKIDLANFELFSSSPKNFTVAVSNRFPTRDWSNVGRFIAEDKRTVQSFELHPHLFGKFVRVDIHSHYSKEHFCPLSLFRVFGTSEFEALETENHPNDDLDDFYDDLAVNEQAKASKTNLFKSASDAVLSIVKKAAEVLAKPASSENQTITTKQPQTIVCQTPASGQFSCADCSNILVERINNALSCELTQLHHLLNVQPLRMELLNTRICAKQYKIDLLSSLQTDCLYEEKQQSFGMDMKQSYFLNLLPQEYIGALCQLLSQKSEIKTQGDSTKAASTEASSAYNLTIDKKLSTTDKFKVGGAADKLKNKLINPKKGTKPLPSAVKSVSSPQSTESGKATPATEEELPQFITIPESTQLAAETEEQLPHPPTVAENIPETTTPLPTIKQEEKNPAAPTAAADVNIFNVPKTEEDEEETEEVLDKTPVWTPTITTGNSVDGSIRDLENQQEESTTPTEIPALTTQTTKTDSIPTANLDIVTPPTINAKSEEDFTGANWENLDNLLSTVAPEMQNANSVGGTIIPTNGINLQQKLPTGPQSESVFIRLSNRIKALERNMSLSGQYLEELSRRYKKQVEELHQALTQQTKIVRTLEEQNQQHLAMENLIAQRHLQLKEKLDEMTLQLHACIFTIIFIGAFMVFMLIVGLLIFRSLRRDTNQLMRNQIVGKQKTINAKNSSLSTSHKLNRRKSFDELANDQKNAKKIIKGDKQRRPSEEAMLILKNSGDVDDGLIEAGKRSKDLCKSGSDCTNLRQRKISVCYGSAHNVNSGKSGGSKHKRKGEKHSWAGTNNTNQPPWQRVELLDNSKSESELKMKISLSNGCNLEHHKNHVVKVSNSGGNGGGVGKSRKKSQIMKRHESAPGEFISINGGSQLNATIITPVIVNYDESLRLEDDDLNNFLPNSDLAYNEFMPEGPSGYFLDADTLDGTHLPLIKEQQCVVGSGGGVVEKNELKKKRRLSSPNFFKSTFSKSFTKGIKAKPSNLVAARQKKNMSDEATSWEWYRSHKTNVTNSGNTTNSSAAYLLRPSPAASGDSSSLSEINFPTNSNENSFRILEEAILSSGDGGDSHLSSNRDRNSSESGSGSNRSSTSSNSALTTAAAKKKNRSFNKIFRKVF